MAVSTSSNQKLWEASVWTRSPRLTAPMAKTARVHASGRATRRCRAHPHERAEAQRDQERERREQSADRREVREPVARGHARLADLPPERGIGLQADRQRTAAGEGEEVIPGEVVPAGMHLSAPVELRGRPPALGRSQHDPGRRARRRDQMHPQRDHGARGRLGAHGESLPGRRTRRDRARPHEETPDGQRDAARDPHDGEGDRPARHAVRSRSERQTKAQRSGPWGREHSSKIRGACSRAPGIVQPMM